MREGQGELRGEHSAIALPRSLRPDRHHRHEPARASLAAPPPSCDQPPIRSGSSVRTVVVKSENFALFTVHCGHHARKASQARNDVTGRWSA